MEPDHLRFALVREAWGGVVILSDKIRFVLRIRKSCCPKRTIVPAVSAIVVNKCAGSLRQSVPVFWGLFCDFLGKLLILIEWEKFLIRNRLSSPGLFRLINLHGNSLIMHEDRPINRCGCRTNLTLQMLNFLRIRLTIALAFCLRHLQGIK